MVRVLVVELIHADRVLYRSATESMREEGRAMLEGVVSDLCGWPEAEIVVAVAPNVTGLAFDLGSGVSREVCDDVSVFLDVASGQRQCFDVAFCIAPEECQLLRRTVSQIRQCVSRVISVRDQLIQLGSDKLEFHNWCVARAIATIPMLDPRCCELWPLRDGDLVVEKNRFGAGSEGIRRFEWGREISGLVAQRSGEEFVWQPFISGRFYSVGVIGRGSHADPLVLPVVRQLVDWSGTSPRYLGGRVPCSDEVSSDPVLVQLVEKVVSCLAVDDGYVGLDLVHCPSDCESPWRVVEMNPRLCTSYLGYRELFSTNLAAYWWGGEVGKPCVRAGKVVEFRVRMR